MFHIKTAELFKEEKLPDVDERFVVHKCGSPGKKTKFLVRDTRASTMMTKQEQEQKTQKDNRAYVNRTDFFRLLKGIYDNGGMGGVQEILMRYRKPHMMKDFIAYLIREGL